MAVPRRTVTLLRKLANQVGGSADATVKALAGSWSQAWDELSPAWQQGITALVDQYQRTGSWPAPWQVARIEAIAVAQQRTERSLTVLLTEAAATTRDAAADVSRGTIAAELDIIGSQQPGLDVRAAPAAAVERALTARQARIVALHRPIPAETARAVRQVTARRPLRINVQQPLAQQLHNRVRAGFETGLTRASTIARTETVDTYRTAAAIVDEVNARILTNWAWHCSCDRRSCTACWAMHGQQFPLDVAGPAGHPGCRCTRLPLVAGVDLPSAEARFRRLPRRDQLAILGPGRLELLRSGQVAWADLAMRKTTTGWRDSYVPAPLADLQRAAARQAI